MNSFKPRRGYFPLPCQRIRVPCLSLAAESVLYLPENGSSNLVHSTYCQWMVYTVKVASRRVNAGHVVTVVAPGQMDYAQVYTDGRVKLQMYNMR